MNQPAARDQISAETSPGVADEDLFGITAVHLMAHQQSPPLVSQFLQTGA